MKILFTGAGGFVGNNVFPQLCQNYKVVKNKQNLLDKRLTRKAFENTIPDVVIHCAGLVGGIGANKARPADFFEENMIMGMNVIKASALYGVKKIIMLGTVCSYPKFTPVPFKEEYLWNGFPEETNAPYGVAKRALMEMLRAFHLQYGLKYTTLIPTNMYGPYDHFNLDTSHVIPALIQKLVTAKEQNLPKVEIWGSGNPSREFLFAEDLAAAVDLTIQSDYIGEINIGTGIETKISELVSILKDIIEFKGRIEYNSRYPDGQPRRCLNVDRAKEVLNFSANTSLESGLQTTVRWYYDNIWNSK